MLWKKETKNGNSIYVDLFEPTLEDNSIERQFKLTNTERTKFRARGEFSKSDSTAYKLQSEGDFFRLSMLFTKALESYNKSLCFAENGSVALALAYVQRSQCFFEMKMFKKCLADIELARQNNHPAPYLLDSLKNKCLMSMRFGEDRGEISEPKLDFEPNKKFPCLADAVDIRKNKNDRHIVATADIGVGKTVIVEKCYIGVSKFDHYKTCNICLKENQNFVPCKNCTSALFCLDCKENNLHEIECNMNSGCPAGFKFMDVVRSISLAKNAFPNADELIAFVEDILKSDALLLPSSLVDEPSKYRAFFNSSPWKNYDLHLEQAYLFYRLLLEQKTMKEYFQTKAHKRFLMHLVQHHISMILQGAINKRVFPIGGVYITDTYINLIAKHLMRSPNSNVRLDIDGGYIICTVTKPIKKDEILKVNLI